MEDAPRRGYSKTISAWSSVPFWIWCDFFSKLLACLQRFFALRSAQKPPAPRSHPENPRFIPGSGRCKGVANSQLLPLSSHLRASGWRFLQLPPELHQKKLQQEGLLKKGSFRLTSHLLNSKNPRVGQRSQHILRGPFRQVLTHRPCYLAAGQGFCGQVEFKKRKTSSRIPDNS